MVILIIRLTMLFNSYIIPTELVLIVTWNLEEYYHG
jgi:hypothetical protein